MGCCDADPEAAVQGAEEEAARRFSNVIDHDLFETKMKDQKKIKMLLLGAGESGKSTIFKQMRLLYGTERSDDDLRMYGVVVRANVVTAIRKLCRQLRELDLEGELDADKDARQAYEELIQFVVDEIAPSRSPDYGGDWVGTSPRVGAAANSDAGMFLAYQDSIQTLWQADVMRKVWATRATISVVDSHKPLLDEIPRIASPNYKPTTQDLLLARIRTTHVVMDTYRIDDADYELYDVGGQRSCRRKWISCFDGVAAVIFVAALSEYDQTLAEAQRSNRMVEALTLFQSVCNNEAFKDTSILLFLNKRDLFREKIAHSDIAAQKPFYEFSGPAKDYDAGVEYFVNRFKTCLHHGELEDKFIHVTCATDTNNMEFVLASSATIIKSENLKTSGFLGD